MKHLRIEAAAERELEAILDYIAKSGNPGNALRFVQKISDAIETIPELPNAGKPREDLGPGVRQRSFGRYLIFYMEADEAIIVLHVVHGMRDLPAFFGEA